MATGNFYPSEYGIFVLPTLTTDEAIENLKDMDYDITEDNIYREIEHYERITLEDFPINLKYALKDHGISMYEDRNHIDCCDDDDRIIARLELSPGYYSGMQVVVEGNPEELLGEFYDEESYLEDYSPDIEPVLNALRIVTTQYKVFARFSSGETWYNKSDER